MFEVDFTTGTLTPEQKSIVIGEVIHLDYLFFQNEEQPVKIEGISNLCCGKCPDACLCLFCNFYCCGALYPCRCTLIQEDNSLADALETMAGQLEERVAGKS